MTPSGTTLLPISAFLSQQGHDMAFTPPVPDENAWTDSVFDPGVDNNSSLFLLADYTGQTAQYLSQHGGPNLNTQVTGFVTETPIGSTGLMEVSVNLETTNALTWIANISTDPVNVAPLEVGYRAADLVAHPNLTPALSTCSLQLTFQEAVGAPLPDVPRLNENYALYAPPGFAFEVFDFQCWGTGPLAATNDVGGAAGQPALFYTSQVANLSEPGLAGTYPDAFWQEPIDIVPVSSSATHVAYQNGTVFVFDSSSSNDNVSITANAGGGATITSNLGGGTFGPVHGVVVGLGSGNNNVQIASLPGATVDVSALDGNNNIAVGDEAKLVVHLGEGSNNIQTGNASTAQFVCVGGSGSNNVTVSNSGPAVILVAGAGNNNLQASGTGDFIEMLGNGNNSIQDTGTDDFIALGGSGNDTLADLGMGSLIDLLVGGGHDHFRGLVETGSANYP
jgi:hypothetical protein